MIYVEANDIYKPKNVLIWSILSFKAGLLNSAGFILTGNFVSHVTGFGTQMGMAFASNEYSFGIELSVIPIFYILGGTITALLLDNNYDPKKIPNFPLAQFIITCLLGTVNFLYFIGYYSTGKLPLPHDEATIILIALLCLICGLKNGLCTWSTSGKIRTTHLSGLSTDIGLHLPKLFRKSGCNSRYPEKKVVTYVRITTFFAFSTGACFAAFTINQIGYYIFSISFLISLFLLLVSIVNKNNTIEIFRKKYWK